MRKALIILALALIAWPGAAALAQGHARERVRAGQAMPLDRILEQIRRDHPGSFYDAQGPFPDPDGGYYYRLKWLTPDGRVIWLNTDARTGRLLGPFSGGVPAPRYRDDRNAPRRRDDEGYDGFYHGGRFERGGERDRGGYDRPRGRPHRGHGGF